MRSISLIVVHHSASPRHTTVEQVREWHQARGFTDVGYHFLVLWNGRVAPGRPVSQVGAHAKGHNRNSLGVCVMGDNTRPEHMWVPAQVQALRALVQTLRVVYPEAEVRGHRDLPGAATQCPGLDARALLAGG